MTDQKLKEWRNKIDLMTHEEMATLYRYAPRGHDLFTIDPKEINTTKVNIHFMNKFNHLGGMTTEISKKIGL